jgi:Cys-rich protein (TIGR01571 family)
MSPPHMSSPQSYAAPPPGSPPPMPGYVAQPQMQPIAGGDEKRQINQQVYAMDPMPQFKKGSFQHGLCSCCSVCSTCCLGCWCPCILFGRTRQRMLNPEMPKEAQSCCNGDCMGYAVVAAFCPGFTFIFGWMNRRDIRAKYDIDGNVCCDCLTHYCCDCCVCLYLAN